MKGLSLRRYDKNECIWFGSPHSHISADWHSV